MQSYIDYQSATAAILNNRSDMPMYDYVRLMHVTEGYSKLHLTLDDYLLMRDDLRKNGIAFTNIQLEKALSSLGFKLPYAT